MSLSDIVALTIEVTVYGFATFTVLFAVALVYTVVAGILERRRWWREHDKRVEQARQRVSRPLKALAAEHERKVGT